MISLAVLVASIESAIPNLALKVILGPSSVSVTEVLT